MTSRYGNNVLWNFHRLKYSNETIIIAGKVTKPSVHLPITSGQNHIARVPFIRIIFLVKILLSPTHKRKARYILKPISPKSFFYLRRIEFWSNNHPFKPKTILSFFCISIEIFLLCLTSAISRLLSLEGINKEPLAPIEQS